MMVRFACILLASIALLTEPKVQAAESPRQTVTANLSADPETLDPNYATGVIESRVLRTLLNGLTRLDEKGIAQPAIAERWEANEDHTKYTFYLREANWTNGDPVTAADFIWSWRRVIDPSTAAEYAYQLYYVNNGEAIHTGEMPLENLGARAVDDRTLEVELAGPTPFFPVLVSHMTFYPLHPETVGQGDDWHTSAETYVGNGPFRLVEWRNRDRIVVDKNPGYWDAENVRLDRLVFRMLESETTELNTFNAGGLDMTYSVPRPAIPRLRDRPEYRILPLIGAYYISFNCEKPPFDDKRVREAFTKAFDRRVIVENITLAGEKPAYAFVPPEIVIPSTGESFRAKNPAYFEENVREARRLLADAGYPDGRGFPRVTYLYNTQENHRVIAEVLQQMWKQNLGVDVTLENQEWKVYQASQNQGLFHMSRSGWVGDFPDPINFLDVFLSTSGNNKPRWKNERYDALVRESKLTADETARFSLMQQAEEILINDYAIAPIYFYTLPFMQSTRLKGVKLNGLSMRDFTYAWIE